MEQPSALLSVLVLLLLAAMATSFVQWARLLLWYRDDLGSLPARMVPPQPRTRPFWNPGDALIMFGSMQVIAGVSIAVLLAGGWVSRGEGKTATGALVLISVTLAAGIAASLITMAWLRLRQPDFIDKLSLRINDADGLLGLKAALMILPPVLLISAAASALVTYEHPVLDSMVGLNDPLKFAVIFIGTAIITPFVEEFMFRVLLQGGLERLADPIDVPETVDVAETVAPDAPAITPGVWRPRSYWPILVSSIVFAAMHLGQGAAPIPIFFLALGLGFLYRQTGNITAPMIVHMVLNGSTLVIEAVRVAT